MTTKTLRTEPQKRLYSPDARRGFDMFWINWEFCTTVLSETVSRTGGLPVF
jgi:hypothetical protein